jgi:hypothetical protein
MAAKPIERYVKRQIAEQGGWDRILERIASGETVSQIARGIMRQPGGPSISRSFLSWLLNKDPERSAKAASARTEGASAMVDDALHLVDSAPADRDSINKAKVQAEMRVKVAGFIDRAQWGETKQDVHVQVNMADVHLDALRHRMVEAYVSKTGLQDIIPNQTIRQSSRSDSERVLSTHARETDSVDSVETAGVSNRHALPQGEAS